MEFNATFFLSAISFIIFTLLMNKILYRPVMEIVEKRKTFFEENDSNAKDNESKTKELLKNKETKIQSANKKAKTFLFEGNNALKEKKQQHLKKAKEKIVASLNLEKQNLESEHKHLKESILSEVDEIANQILENILKKRTKG